MAEQQKKTYYVSIATGEISQVKTASLGIFKLKLQMTKLFNCVSTLIKTILQIGKRFGALTFHMFNIIMIVKTMLMMKR